MYTTMQGARVREDEIVIRYRVVLEFDGRIYMVDAVTGEMARAWLWERIRGGTTSSSRVVIREVTPWREDGAGHQVIE